MQEYTKIYLDKLGLDETDFCKCELCPNKSTEIHHIIARSKYKKGLLMIENLMAICRKCHEEYGDRIYLMPLLFKIHRKVLEMHKVDYNNVWFIKAIGYYNNLSQLKNGSNRN